MRVIAGKCRSLQLKTPKGLNTRPTLDRIKETLFNMIQQRIPGCIFVDLFSGSGGIGIEALSRGAKKAYFVDSDREALSCIRDNLKFTKLEKDAEVIGCDVFGAIPRIYESNVDIVFIDPPYEAGLEDRLFDVLKNSKLVGENTLIILEAALDKDMNFEGFEIVKEKKYKTNKHIFFEKKSFIGEE